MAETEQGWRRGAFGALAVDTVGVLPIFLTGALAVQLNEDIGMSVGVLGIVFTAYFGAAALLAAPLTRFTDWSGPYKSLSLGMVIYAISFLGIAILAHSSAVLVGFVALAGLSTACTRTASSVLVANNVPPGKQGVAFGLKSCSIPLATLLAGLAVPSIALTIGWRWAYVVSAAAALIFILAIPRDAPRTTRPEHGQTDMSPRLLLLCAACFALGSSAATSLGAYTVSTAVAAGMNEGRAGILIAVGSVIGLLSRLVLGYASDRASGSQLKVVSALLLLGAVGYCLLAVPEPLVIAIAVPLSFATGWAWLGSYSLAIVRLNPIAPGAAVGYTQTGAFVGAIAGPSTLGLLAHHSFAAAWLTAAGASFIAAIAIFILSRFLLHEPTRRQWRAIKNQTESDRKEARQ